MILKEYKSYWERVQVPESTQTLSKELERAGLQRTQVVNKEDLMKGSKGGEKVIKKR